jgi:hypothetical protein
MMNINSVSAAMGQIKSGSDDILNRLETGDVIKARVLETKAGEVTLRLFDGSLLKAAVTDGFSAKEGQNITLTVSARSEGEIYLEIVKNTDTTAVDGESVKKALYFLQIKADIRNIQLASELAKAGIAIDKQTMEKARELMDSFKEIDAPKAVFIATKGLGSYTDGLEQLIQLLDGNLKLGEQLSVLKALAAGLSKAVDGHSAEIKSSIDNSTNTEVLQMTGDEQKAVLTKDMPQTGPSQKVSASQTSASIQASADIADAAASVRGTAQNQQGYADANPSINADIQTAGTSQNVTDPAVSVSRASISSQASAGMANAAASAQEEMLNSPGAVNSAASTQVIDKDQFPVTAKTDTAKGSEAADIPFEVITAKPRQGVSTSENDQINMHSSNIESSLSDIDAKVIEASEKNTLNTVGNTNNDTNGLSSKEGLAGEIQQLFIDTDSPELSQKINVSQIENKIEEKLGNIKALIRSSELSAAESRSINNAAGSVASNIKVLNHLNNNNMIYYQLPLNMHGYNTTAELYVMKRNKRQRKIDPNNNVMFISLDTQNMGRIETLLDVKDKNICINIRTENDRINDFFKENVKDLYNGLNNCGYKLASIRYSLIASPSDPIKQEKLLKEMLSYEHGRVDLLI